MSSKNKDTNKDVKIVHLNPRTELNELEKTAILQFEMEEMSRTQEFKLLNKTDNLSNTSKLDLSEINKETMLPKKKSLYDTISIAIDSLIGKRKKLKRKNALLVNNIEDIKIFKKKKIFKDKICKDIINLEDNVNTFHMYSLNVIALSKLSEVNFKARRYSNKYKKVNNIHINKKHYESKYDELNKYAIDKMYYNAAPRVTLKYKIYVSLLIIFSIGLVISLAYLGHWFYEGEKINEISNSLNEEVIVEDILDGEIVGTEQVNGIDSNETSLYWKYLNTPLSSVNFDELLKQNEDTVGWLIVNNTNVDYPVVQTTDNDYYLNHAFDKSVNSAGWVYADYRNEFDIFNQNTVIYAHGRKDGVMFGSLVNTLNKDWYTNSDNQIIQFSTLGYDTMWQVFSVYKVKAESYYITTDFSSDASYQMFINEMKNRSIYDFNVDVTVDDKLLTLSTCYNDYGMRLVVQAKLVKIQKK